MWYSVPFGACLSLRRSGAAQGFEAEGNEHSWYMLIGSNFVLNAATRRNQFAVHPWAIASNNQRSLDLQFRAVIDGSCHRSCAAARRHLHAVRPLAARNCLCMRGTMMAS